jgi:hypothetical protein
VIEFTDANQQMITLKAEIEEVGVKLQMVSEAPGTPDWDSITITLDEWSSLDMDSQRAIITAAVDRIDLQHSYAIISYKFPVSTSGRRTSQIHLPPPIK